MTVALGCMVVVCVFVFVSSYYGVVKSMKSHSYHGHVVLSLFLEYLGTLRTEFNEILHYRIFGQSVEKNQFSLK